jgi:predicted nucleic acid-binding protein
MSVLAALIDTDVCIDILALREPFTKDALAILKQCKDGSVKGYIAAHSVPNIFYILRKDYTEEQRRTGLIAMCEVFSVVSLSIGCIHNALQNKSFTDFEDCLQMECARDAKANYIVTRNVKHYSNSFIPAILPSDFLKLIEMKAQDNADALSY